MPKKSRSPYYRRLTDPENEAALFRALRRAARAVVMDRQCVASKSAAVFVRLRGGRIAQVFVEVAEFCPELLAEQPASGGLLKYKRVAKKPKRKARKKQK